jgi:hypothetical protein
MCKSAVVNVHLVFSSASAVGSMRETIAATPATSVCMTVDSVKMMSSYVGHRTLSYISVYCHC